MAVSLAHLFDLQLLQLCEMAEVVVERLQLAGGEGLADEGLEGEEIRKGWVLGTLLGRDNLEFQ